MLLAEWRKVNRLTQAAIALRVPVAASTVASWEQGTKIPGPGFMIAIYRMTAGAVTPNDFYDLPDLTAPGHAALTREAA